MKITWLNSCSHFSVLHSSETSKVWLEASECRQMLWFQWNANKGDILWFLLRVILKHRTHHRVTENINSAAEDPTRYIRGRGKGQGKVFIINHKAAIKRKEVWREVGELWKMLTHFLSLITFKDTRRALLCHISPRFNMPFLFFLLKIHWISDW